MKLAKHLTIAGRRLVLGFFICYLSVPLFAQEDNINDVSPPLPGVVTATSKTGWLSIRHIVITGNKRTKDYIIKREMQVSEGDSIAVVSLTKSLEAMKKNIYNTTLFVTVKVEPILINAFDFDIIVTVKERFYIFPLPQFQLADRSFDEWLTKYKGSLSRVNYGIKFVDYNLTGRNDQVRLYVINGYTRNLSASYNAPYSNAKLTEGFYVGAGYMQSKEIAFKTNYDNSFAYFKNGGFVRDYWYMNAGYTIRKAIKKTEIFSVGYSHMKVSDSIITGNFNSRFFNRNSATQGFIDLTYTVKYVDVNNILYPLEGISGFINLQKRGLGLTGGINMFAISAELDKFYDLGGKWYSSMQFAGNIKLPFKQPFINQRALGDNNSYLRGLDYYTIDGVGFTTAKFNLKREILNFTIPTFFNSKTYNKIPFKFYAKVFTDFGYVFSDATSATRLSNKFLATTGVGLDILTLYDIHIRLDYSLNQLGQKRLAVNNRPGF